MHTNVFLYYVKTCKCRASSNVNYKTFAEILPPLICLLPSIKNLNFIAIQSTISFRSEYRTKGIKILFEIRKQSQAQDLYKVFLKQ